MIRDEAALECARIIVVTVKPDASDELIALAASLIKTFVARDECAQKIECPRDPAKEEMLAALADSVGALRAASEAMQKMGCATAAASIRSIAADSYETMMKHAKGQTEPKAAA